MDQAFLDYYSLEPFTQWIHRTLCGVMPEDWAVFIEGLALGIVILLAYAVLAVVLIYMERRVCGAFQCRIGPNRVGGKGGLLQVPADVLKILTKEIIRLRKSDHVLYELAPYLVILASVISFSCLPWHKGAEILDMQIGIFFVLAASSIGVIGILLAGWSSNSKYTIIGAVRSGAMIISYELSLGITVLTMVILSGTMSISGIVESQAGGWNIFRGHVLTLVAFVIYLYSGMHFGFFYLAEYLNLFITAGIATTLFLGGWMPLHVAGLDGFNAVMDYVPGIVWFLGKTFFVIFLLMWIRWTFPRLRIDQVLTLEWKYLMPFSLVVMLAMVVMKVFGLVF